MLAVLGSFVEAGEVTVAVLSIEPVAAGLTVPVAVNVAVEPFVSVTVVLMLPVPDRAPHEFPAPLVEQVHVTPVTLFGDVLGKVSATIAPVTECGPPLVTVIVHVIELPGTTLAGPVLLIERSAVRTGVSTVELLFAEFVSTAPAGAAMVAVLEIVPVAFVATVAETVNVAVAPLFRLIARLMLPLFPETGVPQLPVPLVMEQPHETPVRELGKMSATVAPVMSLGPLLVAVIV